MFVNEVMYPAPLVMYWLSNVPPWPVYVDNAVFSTLPNPTCDLLTPLTVPVNVGESNIVALDSLVTLLSAKSVLTSE